MVGRFSIFTATRQRRPGPANSAVRAMAGGASRLHALLLALVILTSLTSVVPAAEITASLDRRSVPAGEGARFSIRIENGSVTAAKPPDVPNLIIRGPGTARQMSMINGVTTSSLTLTYQIGSMTAGEYQIPGFTLTVDGAEVVTDPMVLTVTPSAAQNPAGLPGGNQPAGPQPSPAPPPAADQNTGFLTVELANNGRKHVWVGEIAPVRIKAWIPNGSRASLASKIQPKNSSFTLHNLSDDPQQNEERLNGRKWLTVTWFGGISATKPGTYAPELGLRASVMVPDTSGGGRTGDPFFDQFIQPTVRKDIELTSAADDSAKLEIRPLPETGKPAGFSGAVGRFAFGKSVIPPTWNTGEPQQIQAEVTGSGNFQLLSQPVLLPGDNWKSYQGQSDFTPRDAASFSGSTAFRFNQVPRQPGRQEVHLEFAYFDPETGEYKIASSPVQSVEITGAAAPDSAALAAETTIPVPAKSAEDPLAPSPPRSADSATRSLVPFAFRPGFQALLISSVLAMVAGLGIRLTRARLHDPLRLAAASRAQALRAALSEADQLAGRGDVPGFFAAARRALQVRLAALWQQPPQAITLADIARRLPADSPVLEFFREADRQEFSRLPQNPGQDLPAWRQLLERALGSLTSSAASF